MSWTNRFDRYAIVNLKVLLKYRIELGFPGDVKGCIVRNVVTHKPRSGLPGTYFAQWGKPGS